MQLVIMCAVFVLDGDNRVRFRTNDAEHPRTPNKALNDSSSTEQSTQSELFVFYVGCRIIRYLFHQYNVLIKIVNVYCFFNQNCCVQYMNLPASIICPAVSFSRVLYYY